MRIFHIHALGVQVLDTLPSTLPSDGLLWISCTQPTFEIQIAALQTALTQLAGFPLVDLHITDLLNTHLPSHYDYTTQYDLLVFRRLTTSSSESSVGAGISLPASNHNINGSKKGGPPVLRRIDTRPVGFAIFDRILLSVHPADCAVRDSYASRLLASAAKQTTFDDYPAPMSASGIHDGLHQTPNPWGVTRQQPASPADLMLRIVNQMVDGYLDLRRDLTRQLDHWQAELLNPHTRFTNWSALLDARLTLHQLDEICEDQRAALQDWTEALNTWQTPSTPNGSKELDLLKVRSRDVLEHIERVVHHVRRLEQNTETTVQMHFSLQSNRTNDIMRTLTALTAVFLPLNLIAAVFGMNFDFLPLIHSQSGLWLVLGGMVSIGLLLLILFWRKKYLARNER
jgi:magnesium transporter